MLRAAVPLLALLALAPAAAALSIDVDVAGPVPVGAEAGPDGLSASAPGADASVQGGSVAVSAPLAPPVGLATPLLGIGVRGSQATTEPASATDAGPAAVAGVPVAVAAPAAGGLALLLALLARAFGLGLSAVPFAGRLFSRIDAPRVLDNPVRARLHDLVQARPGASLEELRAAAGVAWGTAVHHLRRLEAHGLVTATTGARHRYFPANTAASRHKASLSALAQPTAQRIARLVHEAPGIGQEQLCLQLGLRAPAASKHLGRFAAQGLVSVRADGRRRLYEPTAEMSAALSAVAVA